MADIKLNFSSQWPSVQVAMVVPNPMSAGEADTAPYDRKIKHNLGFPPLAVAFSTSTGRYTTMDGIDVDSTYAYITDPTKYNYAAYDTLVIYAIDISTPFNYTSYSSVVGDVPSDSAASNIDLRKFLLHSRAVSPMLLSVTTKDFKSDKTDLVYQSPLNYPTFQFGYVLAATTAGVYRAGVWKAAPLAGQSYPVTISDGYKATINYSTAVSIASIICLRNPAIITNNTVTVNIT